MKLHEEFLVTFHEAQQLWEVAACDQYGRWRHVVSCDLELEEDDEDCELQALRMHRRGSLTAMQEALVAEYTEAGRFEGSAQASEYVLASPAWRCFFEWTQRPQLPLSSLKFFGIDFGQCEDRVVMVHPRSGVEALLLEKEKGDAV